MTRRLLVTLAIALALVACSTSRAFALDPALFCKQPPPDFGAQHFSSDANGMYAWHTGPATPDPPGHVPFYVYIGIYSPTLHAFTGWQAQYVYLSNGQWVVTGNAMPYYDPAVATYPQLSRYRPGGPVEYEMVFVPDGALDFVLRDGWAESCQDRRR